MENKQLLPGDTVCIHGSRANQKLIDIQYAHNRYQLKGISGWQYGIDRLAFVRRKGTKKKTKERVK